MTAHAAARAHHDRHAQLADLEERLVRAFAGTDLVVGSSIRLTERGAERFAKIALDVFLTPPEPEVSEDAATWSPEGESPRES
jgi:hypothetical protein